MPSAHSSSRAVYAAKLLRSVAATLDPTGWGEVKEGKSNVGSGGGNTHCIANGGAAGEAAAGSSLKLSDQIKSAIYLLNPSGYKWVEPSTIANKVHSLAIDSSTPWKQRTFKAALDRLLAKDELKLLQETKPGHRGTARLHNKYKLAAPLSAAARKAAQIADARGSWLEGSASAVSPLSGPAPAAATAARKVVSAAVPAKRFETPGEVHVAENNQTVGQIAAMRGLEVSDLLKFNLPSLPGLTKSAKLYPGTLVWLRGPPPKTSKRPRSKSPPPPPPPPRPAPLPKPVPMEQIASRADAELAAMLPARIRSDANIFLFGPTSDDPFFGECDPPTGGIEDDEDVAEAMADIVDQV